MQLPPLSRSGALARGLACSGTRLQQRGDLARRHLHDLGDLLDRGVALQLDGQLGDGLADAVQQVGLLLRQAERPGLIREGMNDGLAHPPDGIRDELDVLAGIEALGSLDESDIALVDQIQEGQSAAAVFLGKGDHEAQVGLHQDAQSFVIAALDLAPQVLLLLRGNAL